MDAFDTKLSVIAECLPAVGALTFICPADAPLSSYKHAHSPLRLWWTTVGLAGLLVYGALAYSVVLLGTFTWFLLLP